MRVDCATMWRLLLVGFVSTALGCNAKQPPATGSGVAPPSPVVATSKLRAETSHLLELPTTEPQVASLAERATAVLAAQREGGDAILRGVANDVGVLTAKLLVHQIEIEKVQEANPKREALSVDDRETLVKLDGVLAQIGKWQSVLDPLDAKLIAAVDANKPKPTQDELDLAAAKAKLDKLMQEQAATKKK